VSDTSPRGSFWLTKLLIAVNVIVFLYTLTPAARAGLKPLSLMPTISCIAELDCPGRLLASMFLHANILHLAGNMFYLYIVGDNVEITLGRARYLFIYFLSGVIGALVHSIVTLALRAGEAVPFIVGASAAISGLIGAYLVLYPGSRMCFCLGFRLIYYCTTVRASLLLSGWIALQLFLSAFDTGVAVLAHLGGLFTGAGLTYLLADPEKIDRLRVLLAKGYYRGLRIDPWELRIPSRPSFLIMIMILAAILLGGLLGYSAGKMAAYTGEYYVVYVDYLLEAERGPGVIPIYPSPGVYSTQYDRAVFVKKAWVEVRDQPAQSHVVESRRVRCCHWINGHLISEERVIAFESTRVEKSFIVSTAILGALVFLIILSFRAMAEPELFEVTYVPKYLQEKLEKLMGDRELED
jgi:membrane associated rhomboid family serine protease